MREILFRGKKLDNGEWVFGAYGNHTSLDAMIIDRPYLTADNDLAALGFWTVDPATAGQYTGLTDKNGTRIFEGDILCNDEPEDSTEKCLPVFGVVRFGAYTYNDSKNIGFFVEWKDNEDDDYSRTYRKDLEYWRKYPYCEVRGNIHDNPELLKEPFP